MDKEENKKKNHIVTLKDVAVLAGVSQPTVSRVINNDSSVKPLTVKKVKEAIEKLAYEIQPVHKRKGHRAPRRRPKRYLQKQIAVLTQLEPYLLHAPVYHRLLQRIEQALNQEDFNLIIKNLPKNQSWESIPNKLDGAILFNLDLSDLKLLQKLRSLPCVRVMGSTEKFDYFDHVTYECVIGDLAADYFIKHGHKTVACLGEEIGVRKQSFLKRCRSAGLVTYTDSGFSVEDESPRGHKPNFIEIYNAVEKLSKHEVLPTAIFTTSDTVAIGLHQILLAHPIMDIKKLCIIGVNNDYILDNLYPRPLSVDIQVESIADKAIERLFLRMKNPQDPIRQLYLTPVISDGANFP